MPNQGNQRFPVECLGQGRVKVGGSFAPNGSSALAAADMYGTAGWTVAYTSTGLYTVTLSSKYQYLLDWNLGLMLTTGSDKVLQLGVVDVVSAKTVQIRAWDISDAAVADIAADAGNRISFALWLQRSPTFRKR